MAFVVKINIKIIAKFIETLIYVLLTAIFMSN